MSPRETELALEVVKPEVVETSPESDHWIWNTNNEALESAYKPSKGEPS